MATDRPTLTVVVPMAPPRELSPNARVHWRTRHKAMGESRFAALLAVGDALPAVVCPDWRYAYRMTVRLPKGGRRWDDDNLIAAAKGMRDGIAAALAVDDRNLRCLGVAQVRDPSGRGETEFVLWEDDGDETPDRA